MGSLSELRDMTGSLSELREMMGSLSELREMMGSLTPQGDDGDTDTSGR